MAELGDQDDSWRALANCRGMSPDIFFPQKGSRNRYYQTEEACAVCQTCAVRLPCLEFGLYEHWGVWGGMSDRQRRRIRSERRKQREAS